MSAKILQVFAINGNKCYISRPDNEIIESGLEDLRKFCSKQRKILKEMPSMYAAYY